MPRTKLPTGQAASNFIEEGELLNNPPYTWAYADATAREAATGFVSGDAGKLARQLDNDSLWMLTSHDPPSWKDLAASASSNISVQDEGAPVQNTPHTTLNFVGDGVQVTDAGGGVAQISISSGHLHLGVYVDTENGNAEMVYCETSEGQIDLVEVDS